MELGDLVHTLFGAQFPPEVASVFRLRINHRANRDLSPGDVEKGAQYETMQEQSCSSSMRLQLLWHHYRSFRRSARCSHSSYLALIAYSASNCAPKSLQPSSNNVVLLTSDSARSCPRFTIR